MRNSIWAMAAILALAAVSPVEAIAQGTPAAEPSPVTGLQIETRYFTLPNGLKVVMSREPSVPTATVGVYYGIGFRIEPQARTGFAHLFEHLMFQGSANAPKGTFIGSINSAGGTLNGSTRFDYTNYFEVVPSNALEQVLWLEADRMARPVINQEVLANQQGVVANEVKVNVLNQPYGGWPWLDMPQLANENWYNAHNFYGELRELEAATLEDVSAFFKTFYAPNNSVLAIVGDFDPAKAREWTEKYFASIPQVEQPAAPDLSEPRQDKEKRASRVDKLATRPALGIAYHVPPRWTADWYAIGLIDQILAQGRDSRLYDALVQRTGLTSDVNAGVNWGLGNMFNYEGPMLWMMAVFHDRDKPADSLLKVIDAEMELLRTTPVDSATLDRARTKMRSQLYSIVEEFSGLGKLDLLAAFALFDNDPSKINELEDGFAAVTPEQIMKTAQEWLRPTNRTVYTVVAGAN